MKLLDYGINNLTELKAIRKDALKLDYYDQPEVLNLEEEKLKVILSAENPKVSGFLKRE